MTSSLYNFRLAYCGCYWSDCWNYHGHRYAGFCLFLQEKVSIEPDNNINMLIWIGRPHLLLSLLILHLHLYHAILVLCQNGNCKNNERTTFSHPIFFKYQSTWELANADILITSVSIHQYN